MASEVTLSPAPLGVPTLYEHEEGISTATYPHLVMRASNVVQRSSIDVRYGNPSVDIYDGTPDHDETYVQHPKPFDADGTLSMACRTLLIAAEQVRFRPDVRVEKCLVWSPTSCTYVGADDLINVSAGVALPALVAFEAARLAMKPKPQYPRMDVGGPLGITRADCPADATKEELVAQALEIVWRTGNRAHIVWSESEVIHAELTDKLGKPSPRIKPCVVWSESDITGATSANTVCDTKLEMKRPHIVVYGRRTLLLFYPDGMTKKELMAKASEIVEGRLPRVCVVWSSTESIWYGLREGESS